MAKYVSLHNYTSFSIGQALTSPKELFEKSKEFGQTAVAVTDADTMAGMWDSLKASKDTGVKLIAGCEFNFIWDLNTADDTRLTKLVLIAKNHVGYKNLLKIHDIGFENMTVSLGKERSRIDYNILRNYCDGLICLTGDGNGYIPQLIMQDQFGSAKNKAQLFNSLFDGNFALELQPHNLQVRNNPYSGAIDQRKINIGLKRIHDETGIQCVATTGSRYLLKEHFEDNDVLMAISSGQPLYSGQRLKLDKNDFYVKTEEEVRAYFDRHQNMWTPQFIDSLIDNSVKLADSCEGSKWVDPIFSNPSGKELPEFLIKDQPDYQDFLIVKNEKYQDMLEDEAYLRFICEKNIKNDPIYLKRFNDEMEVFKLKDAVGYMLIVWDYVNWAKNNNVSVGVGRGSVGGSYVAYLLGIHNADPVKYGLLFERFYNKLKTSYSDIDLDFSTRKRPLVINYLINKYGKDKVAGVSNFSRITPKVYARDISRCCELGADRADSVLVGNSIANAIPNDAKKFKQAMEAPLFSEYVKQYPELDKYKKLCNMSRAMATHAAAVVIGKRPFCEYVPIRRDKTNALVLAAEKEVTEAQGNIKFDLLGLSTLDIIDDTLSLIKETNNIDLKVDLEGYDEKTYDLISKGNTFCVFQLGTSPATIHLCKMMKPKNIEDLALITTLARPACAEFREDFFKVRSGTLKKELLHPTLESAFKETLGFPMYDESLLTLADSVAKWDYAEADKLRKLTKDKGKHPEKVAKWREEFAHDALKNNSIENEIAYKIWDEIIEPFGKYSFNKSHAVLYSLISYYTAYLKAHYPLEFLLANLMSKVNSNSPKAKDEVIRIKQEIRDLGVKIVPPDINTSGLSYKIIGEKTLMTGLDAMRSVKEGAVQNIIENRPFNSFIDIIVKTDTTKVRSTVIQALAASGALDSMQMSREHMFFYCSDYRAKLRALKNSLQKKVEKGKLTQEQADIEFNSFEYPFPKEPKWKMHEMYALEKHFLGEGISGTISDRFPKFFDSKIENIAEIGKKLKYKNYSDDLGENRKANTHFLGNIGVVGLKAVITKLFEFKVKKEDSSIFGQIMARITVQDIFNNSYDIVAFPDAWQRANDRIERQLSGGKDKLEPGIAIYFDGSFQWDSPDNYSVILNDILSYKEAPKLPKPLKSKKVKIKRQAKISKEDLQEMNKEDLADALEDEFIFDALSGLDEEFDFR